LFTPSTHLELEEIILTRIHDVTDLEEQREGNERGMGRMRRENDEVKVGVFYQFENLVY
jgi:hypothetical protein